jgi:hypothetical protein
VARVVSCSQGCTFDAGLNKGGKFYAFGLLDGQKMLLSHKASANDGNTCGIWHVLSFLDFGLLSEA